MKSRYYLYLGILIVSLGFTSINSNTLFSYPDYFPKPIYEFSKNPLSQQKIDLGRQLFYEPMLSVDGTISCASCHLSYTSFTHTDHALSHGIFDNIGFRNSPVLVNLAWQKNFMWDGAVNHIDIQALAPIENPLEMGEELGNVINKLQTSKKYPKKFYQAFGDSIITGENLLKALAQFQLTFISANSKYDQMKRGEVEFSKREMKGYKLFQQHCNSCHQEPLFTTHGFANNGLPFDYSLRDLGRYRITKQRKDSLLFKIPTLRNITFSSPYMHDGRFKNLYKVLEHYEKGIHVSPTLAKELTDGIQLTTGQKVNLLMFLQTLSDNEFVSNQKFTYPKINF